MAKSDDDPASFRRPVSRPKPFHWAMAGAVFLFFAVTLLWPIAQVVWTGFSRHDGSFTFQYVRLIFADPVLIRGLFNATLVAGSVAALSLVIALPLAFLSVRYQFRGRGLFNGLLLAPLVLPPFVGALGVRFVLSRFGPLTQLMDSLGWMDGTAGVDWLGRHRLLGVVLVEALHLYPVMLLNVQASLANIDPAMEQAAANLGAGRWRIFRSITLPLMRPGLFAGCTLVLIWSFTELGTPMIFDFYEITPVQVFKQITDVADNPLPYALVVVMLLAAAGLYAVGKAILGRDVETAVVKATAGATSRLLHGWRAALAAAPFVLVLILALSPHAAVAITSVAAPGTWHESILPRAFTVAHYRAALANETVLPSVAWSIRYAALATCLSVVVGVATAIVVVRSNVPFRGLLDALAMLPLAVPGVVLAFGYLSISVWFKRQLGDRTPFFLNVQDWPVLLLILAYAVRRVPYIVRAAAAGLLQTPRDLELAASNLGATRFRVLWRITGPLIVANLLAGAVLAFAFSMLDVSDSLVLAQRVTYYPITKAIYELSMRLGDGFYVASALGVWAMILLTLTLLLAASLVGRKMGALFRA